MEGKRVKRNVLSAVVRLIPDPYHNADGLALLCQHVIEKLTDQSKSQ